METQSAPQTTPVTPPAAPASQPPRTINCDRDCKDCIRGGIPLKKEWVSLFAIVSFAAAIILFVLFVNAKREALTASRQVPKTGETATGNVALAPTPYPQAKERTYTTTIALPKAKLTGGMPVNQAIVERRSRREFSAVPVTQAELAQMLFSGQGMVDPTSTKRTAPSARESYPMTIFVSIKNVEGIAPGFYEYLPKTHALGKVALSDLDTAIKDSGVQEGAQKAPVVFFISAAIGNYQAKTKSANAFATYMEAGHIGQNMYLTAESLDMSMVVMAGFDNAKVTKAMNMDPAETVEYVVPFGHRAPEVPATPEPKK